MRSVNLRRETAEAYCFDLHQIRLVKTEHRRKLRLDNGVVDGLSIGKLLS